MHLKSTTYSEYICTLCYPACNAHAPYYIVICGLSVYEIFFHIISQTAHFLEYSYWIQLLNTVTEYSYWLQLLNTVTHYSYWIQLLNTVTDYSYWIQLLNTVTEYSYWIRGWIKTERQFLNYAVTETERSWIIAQYWQCLLKSSAMCSTALCLQSSGSNEGENMGPPFQDSTIEEQRGVVRFLWAEGVKPVETHRRVFAHYGQSTMSQRKV